jgi:hypothetical protein
MNQFQLSNSLTERLRSFQQQSTAISMDQQGQLNAFMGGLLENDPNTFGGAQQADDTFDDRNHHDNHVDIAPLPLNGSHFTGLTNAGGIDRQALDELYKTLSNGDHHLDTTNGVTFPMSNANVNFGNSVRPMNGMYSTSNPGFSFPTQFQHQLGYPQQNNNNMTHQQNQGGIVFPSIFQDGASASQLSSEALMNSLFSSTNLDVLNHLQMKNTIKAPMPLVHHQVELELVKKPVKALSAYNFFFRDQRDRILHGAEEDYSAEKQEELLSGQ